MTPDFLHDSSFSAKVGITKAFPLPHAETYMNTSYGGADLNQNKRLLSALLAFCILICALSPAPCFASSELPSMALPALPAASVSTVQVPQPVAPDISGIAGTTPAQETLPGTVTTSAGLILVTAGFGMDASVSGPAIDTTTTGSGILISASGAAIMATTSSGIVLETADTAAIDENLWFRKSNPMKKEHQKLLWTYCKARNLDYIDMLALISTESNFYEKCSTGKYFGYFQISKGNCANLSVSMKTANKPLDGTINLNWGTAMFSGILADKRVKGLEGKKRRDVAIAIYQRGTGGYDRYGINKAFLKVFYKKKAIVSGWYAVKN